ncbi:MAG: hypothetical protein IIY07_00610 [Thermoguttaceae bacterium]|nr:hypothetical protein [Thermoguttaceae bacterium]
MVVSAASVATLARRSELRYRNFSEMGWRRVYVSLSVANGGAFDACGEGDA